MALVDDLIAYWQLDEASGTRLDAHGANHLTDHNSVGSVAGKVGNAASFTAASSQYLDRADSAALSLGGGVDFSFSLWVKWNGGGGGFPVIMSRRMGVITGQTEFILYYNAGGDTLNWIVWEDGCALTTMTAGTWYHVVCWYDAVANLSGIVRSGVDGNGAAVVTDPPDLTVAFELGACTAQGLFWDGVIDQVGFWKRVLTSDERTYLYNGGAGRSYAEVAGIPTTSVTIPAWRPALRPAPFRPGIAR